MRCRAGREGGWRNGSEKKNNDKTSIRPAQNFLLIDVNDNASGYFVELSANFHICQVEMKRSIIYFPGREVRRESSLVSPSDYGVLVRHLA